VADAEEISILGEIERLANRDHFAAFTIVMSSGEHYDIGRATRSWWERASLMFLVNTYDSRS
jgi:hypothetical protein